jgi:hypothetical protein
MHKRALNPKLPHIKPSKTFGVYLCNIPASGKTYETGFGWSPEGAYDSWYNCNFDKVVGRYNRRSSYEAFRAAGLKTITHPALNTHHEQSPTNSSFSGNFVTSNQREP